ncbi:hypothetical protein MJM45_28240, partial [Salmonella enterica subsp. enterica serovar Kentucky]|nr:hypothetical protein [Salmonella enterica subsp. enterica serovar Kentucky]
DFERYWRCSSVSTLQQVLSLSEQELTQRIELPESWYNDEITRYFIQAKYIMDALLRHQRQVSDEAMREAFQQWLDYPYYANFTGP